MGNGSGPGSFNSRVFSNSYSYQVQRMAFPFRGNSFGGLSAPQYSYNTYSNLAYLGAGAGNRAGRWAVAHNQTIAFQPPAQLLNAGRYTY
jgi:hypothetical protein